MNVLTFYLSFSEVVHAYPQHIHSDIVSIVTDDNNLLLLRFL